MDTEIQTLTFSSEQINSYKQKLFSDPQAVVDEILGMMGGLKAEKHALSLGASYATVPGLWQEVGKECVDPHTETKGWSQALIVGGRTEQDLSRNLAVKLLASIVGKDGLPLLGKDGLQYYEYGRDISLRLIGHGPDKLFKMALQEIAAPKVWPVIAAPTPRREEVPSWFNQTPVGEPPPQPQPSA